MGLPCSDLRKTEWRKFNFEERKVRNQTEPIKFEMPFSYSEAPPGGSDGKEGQGGEIWDNGIETCIISCMKRVASPGSMHDTGCLGLVHWDDP